MDEANRFPAVAPATSDTRSEWLHDPREGVSREGFIVTGARRDRVPRVYEPVLDAAIDAVRAHGVDISLYLYGSVATGMALPPGSDVDLFTIGLPQSEADELTRKLSMRFRDLCRAVNVGAAQRGDYDGEDDEAYGNRVFLRHYGVHCSGPDLHSALPDFLADAAAARGLNGDVAQRVGDWRAELCDGGDPQTLGRRIAGKCLFALTGLVSVRDHTWTTDRRAAVARWGELEPATVNDLRTLAAWSRSEGDPDNDRVIEALDGVVARLVSDFAARVGLWA